MISHEDLVSTVDQYIQYISGRDGYAISDWSIPPRVRMWVLSNGKLCTLVRAEQTPDGGSAGLEVVGGGGIEIAADAQVFRHAATRAAKYMFGSLFASVRQDGRVLIASRIRIPAAALRANDTDSFGFAAAMINNLSGIACGVAQELMPAFGGRHLRADSETDVANLGLASGGD